MTKHTRPPKRTLGTPERSEGRSPPPQRNQLNQRTLDPERAALALRAQRAARCEAEIGVLLEKHRCALQAVQVMTNGIPGPMTIRVVPLDTPPPAGDPAG